MQPTEKNRIKPQAGIARAKLLLKRDLPWLGGYPIAFESGVVRWQSVPWEGHGTPEIHVIDRESIRRGQLTLSKLRNQFPHALPKVVGDVDNWLGRMDHLFDLLKRWIHEACEPQFEDVLNCERFALRWQEHVRLVRDASPKMRRLIEAALYLILTERKNSNGRALDWLSDHELSIKAIVSDLDASDRDSVLLRQVQLLCLRDVIDDELVVQLAAAIGQEDVRECPVVDADAYATALRKTVSQAVNGHEFELPAPSQKKTVLACLIDAIELALTLRPRRRQLWMSLWGEWLTTQLIEHIRDFRTTVRQEEKRLDGALRSVQHVGRLSFQQRTRLHELATSGFDVKADARVLKRFGELFDNLRSLSDRDFSVYLDLLRVIPKEYVLCRMAAWSMWEGLSDRNAVLRELIKMLRQRGSCKPLFEQWQRISEGPAWHYLEFVNRLCNWYSGKPRVHRRAIRLLGEFGCDGESLSDELMATLPAIASVVPAFDESVALCQRLMNVSQEHEYSDEEVSIAYAFADRLDEMIELVAAVDKSDHVLSDLQVTLVPLAKQAPMRRAIKRFLMNGDDRKLGRLMAMSRLLRGIQQPALEPQPFSTNGAWMQQYPQELHPELEALDRWTGRGRDIAGNILATNFPDREALRRELKAIENKLLSTPDPQLGLEKRRGKLKERLRERPAVSPKRIDNLKKKLQARADTEYYERLLSTGRNTVKRWVRETFGVENVRDDFFEPPIDQVFAGVMSLGPQMRRLGLRLIFESTSGSTHPYDQEPANQRFRRRMEAKGITMSPWLSNEFCIEKTTAAGLTYEVGFTRDVIDFLLMGFHFGTCLAPGSFNFFSTIANAVDLNKRVVYGRTKSGQLIGRCLFALTNDGGILTFHRYSHDSNHEFEDAIARFATQLATEMNAFLCQQGNVQKLVAGKWYDDGARPIASNPFSEDGVAWELIRNHDGKEVVTDLLNRVNPAELRAHLRDIFDMDEVRTSESLAVQLINHFLNEPITSLDRLALALAAFRHERFEVSADLIARRSVRSTTHLLRSIHCDACSCFHGLGSYREVLRMFLQYNPSIAIRVIRGSRQRRIRADSDDGNRARREVLAEAQEKLGRQGVAEQLRSGSQRVQ